MIMIFKQKIVVVNDIPYNQNRYRFSYTRIVLKLNSLKRKLSELKQELQYISIEFFIEFRHPELK